MGLLLLAALLPAAAPPSKDRVPNIEALKTRNPPTTAMIKLRRKEARKQKKRFRLRQTWVPLGRISPHLQNAVLAAEDDRFYRHEGVEWGLTQKALLEQVKTRKKGRGA